MIRRLVVLALLVGGAVLLEPLRASTEGVIAPRSLFLFGILLLTADTFGALTHDAGLPRLVGYLLAGLALGPSVTGIVSAWVSSWCRPISFRYWRTGSSRSTVGAASVSLVRSANALSSLHPRVFNQVRSRFQSETLFGAE